MKISFLESLNGRMINLCRRENVVCIQTLWRLIEDNRSSFRLREINDLSIGEMCLAVHCGNFESSDPSSKKSLNQNECYNSKWLCGLPLRNRWKRSPRRLRRLNARMNNDSQPVDYVSLDSINFDLQSTTFEWLTRSLHSNIISSQGASSKQRREKKDLGRRTWASTIISKTSEWVKLT